jgi:hypothetical protein
LIVHRHLARIAAASLLAFVALGSGCGEAPIAPDMTDGGPGPDTTQVNQVIDVSTLMPAPAPGTGFQIGTPKFDVPAGMEIQDCYFIAMPADKETWVQKIQIGQNPGTHHMNIFRRGTQVNLWGNPGDVVHGAECWKSPNWADWPLVANSQISDPSAPINNWQLPDGVAMKFEPGEVVMLQTHYVNATTQVTPGVGHVLVNFTTIDKSKVQHELGTLFATNQGIRACPGQRPSFTATCNFARDGDVTVIAANSHFHSRGVYFSISVNDPVTGTVGPKFYENTDWQNPKWDNTLHVTIPKNGGVEYECDYAVPADACGNPNDECCFTFGGFVETQEHCNVFVYYYPRQSTDVGCF